MLADPRLDALVDNFAGQWLVAARTSTACTPDPSGVSRTSTRTCAQALQRETELFVESQLREDRSVARSADGELHVPQRAAGAALRDSERLRQPVPARHARRRHAARRAARPGQPSDGHVVPDAHVAGRCAASGCSRTSLGRRRRRRRRTCPACRSGAKAASRRRCASGSSSTARTPSARPATRRWIRSASRSRTSTGSASGGRHRGRRADRCVRRVARRRRVRGAGGAPGVLLEPPRSSSSSTVTEKLMTYALGRELEYLRSCRPSGRSCAARRPATIAGRP